jgi:hypothetical protein
MLLITSLLKWASVIGLVLTAVGVLVGFYLPTVAGRWGGPDTARQEFLLRVRFIVGISFVLTGTVLQVCGAWPR